MPKYTGVGNAIMEIIRQESIRGLYRGVAANVIGAGSAWGLHFLFYNTILKSQLIQESFRSSVGSFHHELIFLESAFISGFMSLLLTNPLWVVKTQLCLQYGPPPPKPDPDYFTGLVDALKKIYQKEGIRGYYKGFIPGMFAVSNAALQFTVYEKLKAHYKEKHNLPTTTKLGPIQYMSFAAVSKLISTAATYPYQVVRTRMQNQHYHYAGSLDCIVQTWRFEGAGGFYKGLNANLVKVVPQTMIIFLTYETVFHMFQQNPDKRNNP